MERFKENIAAVMVLLKSENKVLLQKRSNTGYMDDYWDFSATGHVEFGESMKVAGVRETLEEIGVVISEENMNIITMMHKYTKDSKLTYFNGFFIVDKFEGLPKIMEPHKCSDLRWFDLDELPEMIIPDRKLALDSLSSNEKYIEIGW